MNALSSVPSSLEVPLQRLELISLHLIAGCDFYLPLTLQLVLDIQEKSTLSDELLSHEDDVLLMANHPDYISSLQAFEDNVHITKARNAFDYEDESL